MSTISPRRSRSLLSSWPALPDWSEIMARFDAMPAWPSLQDHMIRVEEQLDGDRYILRAELPGIDPDKDVDIRVRDGSLSIMAERSEEKKENTRSEFRYGTFSRSMSLPPGAVEDGIEATYADGILTVTVPVSEPTADEKQVAVKKISTRNGDKR
ncbi:Hsp20/alpha crystallin family protein [Rhodococcus sp. Z13]|uniref:Hsp20/alpha crystallin family protein n=1 Tax=Rhodococcus sacchari TaxID=2962047 RepID=A0ACD4DB21_9NOCA|nr:Hsp20/alpha crystallin family protein [Rhodococcus sp. Z13]UYP17182.1 Hsp20/alpha crystallin family protein [Rhodococcus sp. Z13]